MFYSKYEKMTKGSIQELKDILHAWQTLSTVAKASFNKYEELSYKTKNIEEELEYAVNQKDKIWLSEDKILDINQHAIEIKLEKENAEGQYFSAIKNYNQFLVN